jgi:hypothetical protein
MVGVWIHAALQHVPLYSVWELGTSDVADRMMTGCDEKAVEGSCQVRIINGAAQSERKKPAQYQIC